MFDFEAERTVIGSTLVWPDRLEGVADDLVAEHFRDPDLGAVWRAVTELVEHGRTVDELAVADRARSYGAEIEVKDLIELMDAAVPPNREHVEIVLRYSAARETMEVYRQGAIELGDGESPYDVAARSAEELDRVGEGVDAEPEAMTLPELVARAADAAPWVIPGLLRTDWRVVVVAAEGSGKSTLLRQLAVGPAQGVHPLTFQPMTPIRTLIVDAENPLAAIAETGAVLDRQARLAAGDAYDPERCKVWSQPGGINLREPGDRAAFVRELRAHRPQLVVMGPVYKLGVREKGEGYEDLADAVLAVLDKLRTRFRFGIVLEHHAPKGRDGHREMSPFGSQRWLAWPELGISLLPPFADDEDDLGDAEDVRVLGRFRGDRLRCAWPDELHRGDGWPWEGVWHGGTPRLVEE
jgi:replicative DNA helicase